MVLISEEFPPILVLCIDEFFAEQHFRLLLLIASDAMP
jgi:hypothetical protein